MAQNIKMKKPDSIAMKFFAQLGQPNWTEDLFDQISDTVFFLKDREGRYVAVNETLVKRCACAHKNELIGRKALDFFPAPLGQRIVAQDMAVIRDGKSIRAQLELHLYPGGGQGWCLTWKEPVLGRDGRIIGLSGISRDLQPPAALQSDMAALSVVLDHIRENLDRSLPVPELAAMAGLSTYQLDQRIRSIFGISAGQYVTRARIELACNRLRQTDQPISRIALDCGYADQAAFARQFRRSAGLTPRSFRDELSPRRGG